MHNIFGMAKCNCTYYLPKNSFSFFLRQSFLHPQILEQLAPLQVLHHKHHVKALRSVEVEDFDDVRMVQCLQVLSLSKNNIDCLSGVCIKIKLPSRSDLICFIATSWLVDFCRHRSTLPKPPCPNTLTTSYSP